ncbi:MAG TPA: ATP-binding protein [bacterium]|nr:ATP-binding protein [bacterium]
MTRHPAAGRTPRRRPHAARGPRGAGGSWRDVARAAASLVVVRGVLDDPAGQAWRDLVGALAREAPDAERAAAAYARLFTLLAAEAELASGPLVGDVWQTHLIGRLLDDDNPFSHKAERAPWGALGPALVLQVRTDLAALAVCHGRGGAPLFDAAARLIGRPAVAWDAFRPLDGAGLPPARMRMMRRVHAARDWPALARDLAAYFASEGVGLFGRYRTFRWVRDAGFPGGGLEGVAAADPVRLADLVDYELEREPVIDNTRQFVAGGPANNVLLYGDRGTGKSSTIKALANEYAGAGLRLIEVAKDHLADYPHILAPLRGRRERFILFIDDLSFDEHETQYKALKAVLEGGVEARPENVVLYATSNRRRLVAERFSDRQRASLEDEVNPQEAAEEKLSLADRFGIHVPFLVPDQDRYLRIVDGLATRYALEVSREELHRRALTWAQWHNGRSCRAARQFVDALRGEAVVRATEAASGGSRSSADSRASSRPRRR